MGDGLVAAAAPPGDALGSGDAPLTDALGSGEAPPGDALAPGTADAPGDALAPTGTSGDGVPLGRTRKTGPLGAALGEAVGNGTGVGVAAPVARGVGGKREPGPAGTGGIGTNDGDAFGEGDPRSLGYDGTALGTSPTPWPDEVGTGCCAISAESLANTKEDGVLVTDGFGGGV